MTKVKLGLIQMTASAAGEENLAKAESRLREAAKRGARILCLQELFHSLYFCRQYDESVFKRSQAVPGPLTDRFSRLAAELAVVLVVPLFEKRADGIYHNSAIVIDADGRIMGHYRKMHIPDDPNYYEKYYFTPGDLGFNVFPTRYGKISVLICWDQWFPEAARLAALKGAEILFYPTAIGWDQKEPETERRAQEEAWEIVQRGHAVANGIFVAAVNRVGREGPLTFWGRSFVADPFGRILGRAGDKEEALIVECDLSRIGKTRRGWPFLRDRRIDAYEGISERFLDEKPSPSRR